MVHFLFLFYDTEDFMQKPSLGLMSSVPEGNSPSYSSYLRYYSYSDLLLGSEISFM